MTDTVTILKGLTMPFFPMRPAHGQRLTKELIPRILEHQKSRKYVYQPKLNGDRVILGVSGRRVVACNRHGSWYQFQVENAKNFLKLGDGSCFDGEVWQGSFYPFECLALDGRSFRHNTTEERVIMAEQMCRYLKIRWMFSPPTEAWLMELDKHLPTFEGVVRKVADAGYGMLASDSQYSTPWLKHRF